MNKPDKDSTRIKDLAAELSEHFGDYVIIGRVKDGLIWRFSDRTFALGAATRLQERLSIEDRLVVEEIKEND